MKKYLLALVIILFAAGGHAQEKAEGKNDKIIKKHRKMRNADMAGNEHAKQKAMRKMKKKSAKMGDKEMQDK
jgi:hypothetical protein